MARRKKTPDVAPAPDAVPDVKRLSELEMLRFVRADTELHNHKLEIKTLEQEYMLDQAAFEQRRAARANRIALLKQSIRIREQEQRAMLVELGAKYDFDPSATSIDDQTGVIHSHNSKK